jgi:hypothetical protein
VAIALGLVLLMGCQKSLPTAPSPEREREMGIVGIIVYEHINFEGNSGVITDDISDLRDFSGPCREYDSGLGQFKNVWNDCMSSVRVAPGWKATIYRDTGYRDDSVEIDADVRDLGSIRHNCPKGGLNDCVSSIRVRRP